MKKNFSILLLTFSLFFGRNAFGQSVWNISTSAGAWLTAGNWTPSGTPGTSGYAQFQSNPSTNPYNVGINMNGSTNNGTNNQAVGAIEVTGSRSVALVIGNSSTAANGILTLNGISVNSTSNVVIRNNTSQLLTLQNTAGSGNKLMGIALANSTENIINIDGSGGITISSIISGTSRNLTKAGSGAGVLTLSGVNTYSGNTTISSGTLALSGSGSIANSPNIIVGSGGTFNVTALTTALTLGAGQKLSASATGSTTTGTITVASGRDITLSAGGLAFTAYGGGSTAPLTVTGATAGALALSSAPVTVTTTSALAAGTYTLIAKGGSATGVTGTPGTLTVNGSGLAAGTIGTLSVVSGQLILTVAPTYTVTYDANGGTGAPTDASSPYTSGATVTVKAPGAMTNSGFTFAGWDTNNDGTAEFTGSGSETFAISANTTLKAVWASSSSPILAITGTPLDHGSVCPTTAATPITYTITNSGGASAAGITVVSSDAQFVVSGLSSTTIAASGGTATYNVTFTPLSAGSQTATITVASSTSGSNSPTSNLTGTGTATVAQAVSTSAATVITASSATINGNVTNIGTCPTAIEKGFVYSITSVNAAPAVGGTGVTKAIVAGIGTGTYNTGLTGLPSSTQYSFTAYVYDGTTYTYGSTLTFTTSNALTLSGTLAHGSICPGSSTSAITYTITNNSISTVTGIAVGSSNGEFVVSGLSSTTIAASGTATYQVTFTPSASGGRSATITVTSSAASVNNTVTGTGTATVAQAVTTSAAGSVSYSSATLNGNVTNTGTCPTATEKGFVYSITSVNAAPAVGGTGVTKVAVGTISAGTYNTGSTGLPSSTQYSFTAYVYDGTTYTYGTTLTFTTLNALTLSGTLAHGSICPGSSTSAITYTITNNSISTVTGIAVGSSNGEFVVSGLSSTSIAASGTATFQVTFTPSASGGRSATITVTSSAASVNNTVTGTGTATVAQAVTTTSSSAITTSTATVTGNVTNTGTCPTAIEKGFVYSVTATNGTPTVGGTGVTKVIVSGIATGTYNTGLTSLSSSTQYSFRAYVYDGTTYTYGTTLTFTTVAPPPANDDCSNAIPITIGAAAVSGTLVSSTYTTNTFAYAPTKRDVWYSFTPLCTGSHTVTLTFTTGPDIDLDVFSTGACPTTGTAGGTSHGTTTTESVTASYTGGTTYYIRVIDYNTTATTFNIGITSAALPQLTLSNTGTPAIGNISPSTTDVPLYGFSLAPNACVTTYDFTGITVTKTGTTTTSDLSNFRIFYDANNNGIVDGGESSVSGAGIALSASMAFTITGQTGLSATRRYLLVADVAAGATNGNTFTGSAAAAGITASISVTGTAAGNQQTVVVIKAEPTNYPTSFNCGTTTATTIQLTWTDASAGVLPDGYLIKWSSVSYAAILDPVDGTAVANGAGVQNVAQGTGNYTVTSLTAGTTYYFKIWSYSNSGTNINYKLTSEPQTSCNTISASSDIINDVTYSLVPSTNFDYKSWQSASQTNASDGLGMFNIIIRDGGASSPDADGLPTILNAISFSCPTFANIRSAALFTTTGTLVQSVTVSSSTITFSGLSGVNVTAPDNGTIELILRLSFKNTPATITDNTKIVFTVSSATAASSASSSQFINATAGGAISDNDGDNENRLEVTADRLAFVQQPSDATTGATMTPAVTVRGNDINAIQDLDFTASISLACSTPAALTSGGGPVSTSAGVATFGSIVHGTNGTYTMSANASGLISGVSNSYTISTFTYLSGDFRPLYTTDLSYNGTWEYNTGSGWITSAGGSWDGKAPQNTTSSIGRVIINDYVTGGGSATKAYNCDFIILNGGELLLVENDAPPVAAEMIAAGKKLEVLNGGILTIEGDIDLASSGNLIVRSGGTMTIDQNSVRNDHPMWDGVELFEGGSTVTIKNWDWTGSSTNWSIFNNNTSISFNANGWKFGNLILDVNNSIQNWQIVGGNLGGIINLCENDLDISNAGTSYTTGATNTTGTNGFVVNGNMTIYDGNFSFGSSYTNNSFNHQFVVNGDFNCISNDALKLHLNGSGTATALTGNVSIKGDFIVGNTVTSFTNDKATDNSVLPLNLSGNGTTQLLTVYPTAVAIPMNVKSNAYVQLSNTDLVVNSSTGVTADFKVEANATLDFNFNVTTPLVIKKVTSGGAGTNSFTSIQGCTLKITAPDGINLASGATGATGQALNVQMTTANTISALATFWYMGKTNQHTGTGIGTASNGRALIVDLSDNIYSLTPDVAFGITGTANTYINSGNGGILDIRKGQFIETVNEYITGSDGALKMGNGTLYKIVKGYSAALATGAEPATPNNFIPRLTGTYTLNGGTIELGGNSTGNYFQTLRGGKTFYSIKFSGSNTYIYPTNSTYNYKNLSSNVAINDSLYISETAVVDCIDRSGDAASFTGNGGLVMDGGRIRIKNSSSTQPELVGDTTAYILTGGTVEFYGTSAIQQQQMRGNYTSAGTKPKVNYYNVDINADASNYSTVAGAGNVDLNSSFTLSGTMNVNSPAVLRMDKEESIDGTGTFNVKNGSGLLYGGSEGTPSSAIEGLEADASAGVNSGNIRTTNRSFSSSASYGFVSSGNMPTGTGLPSTVAGLYVYKTNAADVVTLNNATTTTVNGILSLQNGKILSSGTNKLILEKVGTASIVSPANAGGVTNMGYENSYVIGSMGRITNAADVENIFPIGSTSKYGPISLTPKTSSSQTYTCDYVSSGYGTYTLDPSNSPQLDHVSKVEYWNVSSSITPSANDDAKIKLFWRTHSQVSATNTDWANLRVVHFDGTDWNTEINTTTNISGSTPTWGWVQCDNYAANFSPFTIGTITANNPLPVELTYFTGTCLEDGISQISWTTASEFNSKQFVVERSEDGVHYTLVAVVPAAGFSNQVISYSITDTSVNANSSYYRLIEVDNNNQQTIYSFIQVKCNEVNGVHVYYTQPKVVVEVNSTKDKQVGFNVYEVSGKLVHQENKQVVRGYNRFDLSIKNKLADGIYIIQMMDGDKATSTKIIVH